MTRRKKTKYVHAGQYVAEVEVELIHEEGAWAPYLSVDDAFSLDDVREALRQGDLTSAAQYGRIYELRPVAHQ
jgi:FAD synthase